MNHKKYALIALSIILFASTIIAGFLLYSFNIQKNNIKKVALNVDFSGLNSFEIYIKSNDESNFKLNSLPVKIFVEFRNGENKTFEEDMVKHRRWDSSYSLFSTYKVEGGFKVSGTYQRIFDSTMLRYFSFRPVESVKIQIEGKEFKFKNKIAEPKEHFDYKGYIYSNGK